MSFRGVFERECILLRDGLDNTTFLFYIVELSNHQFNHLLYEDG